MQYKFPNQFLPVPQLGYPMEGPKNDHPELACQFVMNDGQFRQVEGHNVAYVTAKVSCSDILGYRWNDEPISKYSKIYETFKKHGLKLSLHQFEVEMEALDDDFDMYKLFKQATGKTLTASSHSELVRWFKNPERHGPVRFEAGNCVLKLIPAETTKTRRVICPNGHTISYTNARRIYNALSGRKDHWGVKVTMPNSVSARELVGSRNNYNFLRNSRVTKREGYIVIGCQNIPYSAINDLARREGWDK